MDRVQELLSDPESLKQIQELADILNSDINNGSQTSQEQVNNSNINYYNWTNYLFIR